MYPDAGIFSSSLGSSVPDFFVGAPRITTWIVTKESTLDMHKEREGDAACFLVF